MMMIDDDYYDDNDDGRWWFWSWWKMMMIMMMIMMIRRKRRRPNYCCDDEYSIALPPIINNQNEDSCGLYIQRSLFRGVVDTWKEASYKEQLVVIGRLMAIHWDGAQCILTINMIAISFLFVRNRLFNFSIMLLVRWIGGGQIRRLIRIISICR